MKKISHALKKQARRQGALERFSLKPNLGTPACAAYDARKAVELAALKAALGV